MLCPANVLGGTCAILPSVIFAIAFAVASERRHAGDATSIVILRAASARRTPLQFHRCVVLFSMWRCTLVRQPWRCLKKNGTPLAAQRRQLRPNSVGLQAFLISFSNPQISGTREPKINSRSARKSLIVNKTFTPTTFENRRQICQFRWLVFERRHRKMRSP